jgi:hypothetical protein
MQRHDAQMSHHRVQLPEWHFSVPSSSGPSLIRTRRRADHASVRPTVIVARSIVTVACGARISAFAALVISCWFEFNPGSFFVPLVARDAGLSD